MWIFPENSDKRQQNNKVFLLFMYLKKLIIELKLELHTVEIN